MLTYPTNSISRKYSFFIKAMKFIVSGKKSLSSFFIKIFLLACVISPSTINAQDGGCINADTIYVPVNTVPSTINATPASFSCGGSYTYQWYVSADNNHFTKIAGATGQNLSYTLPVTASLVFLREAKCGSITMYTNRVVVYPIYTACADFQLTLTGTAGNALATIKADTIKSNTGNLVGEYVIEWYKDTIDGTPEFVSGSAGATDPAVSVSHPFAGEPAEGGTWHPVIKYIYIDGIKYSRSYTAGARLSPDLLNCLDPIVVIVNNLNCANGGTVTSVYSSNPYAHKITYINGLNSPTLAARSFKFDLDATNKYFAWWFTGYQERDKMKITYVSPNNSTSTVIEWWEVGYGTGAGTNYTTSPKIMASTYMYKISRLTGFTFAAGDYLLIEITPSANANTNWEFLSKCFTTVDSLVWDGTQRNIAPGSVVMTWNAASCSYEVKYKKQATPFTSHSSSTFLKYNFLSGFVFNSGITAGETVDTVRLKLYKQTSTSTFATHSYSTCSSLTSSATVTKNGNTLTMVFNNATDYNLYKNQLAAIQSNANMSNYDPDDTKLNHYKFYYIYVYRGNSCGDAQTINTYTTHVTNTPTFNDGSLTMTWTFATKVNNYVNTGGSCDLTFSTINSWIQNCNFSAGSSSDIPASTTYLRAGSSPYTGLYITQNSVNELQKTFRYATVMPSIDILSMDTKQWTNQFSPSYQWEFSHIYDRVTISNPVDPINNFKLERLMDANGIFITNPANYIKVYEIINGVVQ